MQLLNLAESLQDVFIAPVVRDSKFIYLEKRWRQAYTIEDKDFQNELKEAMATFSATKSDFSAVKVETLINAVATYQKKNAEMASSLNTHRSKISSLSQENHTLSTHASSIQSALLSVKQQILESRLQFNGNVETLKDEQTKEREEILRNLQESRKDNEEVMLELQNVMTNYQELNANFQKLSATNAEVASRMSVMVSGKEVMNKNAERWKLECGKLTRQCVICIFLPCCWRYDSTLLFIES